MRALAETVHTPIELHLFSDMQGSNMPANFADMVMPGNVSLVLHPVAATCSAELECGERDRARRSLSIPRRRVCWPLWPGMERPRQTRTVSLVVNGKVAATKKVQVPADGRATVAFEGAGRALWRKPLRGPHRYRGRICCRRHQPLRREARRPRARPVPASAGRYAFSLVLRGCAWLLQARPRSCCSRLRRSRRPTSTRRGMPSWCFPMSRPSRPSSSIA